MPTNTAGSAGQDYHHNMVHYVAKTITFSNEGTTVTVGVIPPGAVVIEAGVVVTTVFNGSTPVVDLGTSDDKDCFGSDLSLETAGRILDTDIAANNDYSSTAAVTLVADLSDSNASAGSAVAYFLYFIADR